MPKEYVENMKEKEKTDPLKVISVRFEISMIPQIEAAAKEEDRKTGDFIRHIVKDYLRKREMGKKTGLPVKKLSDQ